MPESHILLETVIIYNYATTPSLRTESGHEDNFEKCLMSKSISEHESRIYIHANGQMTRIVWLHKLTISHTILHAIKDAQIRFFMKKGKARSFSCIHLCVGAKVLPLQSKIHMGHIMCICIKSCCVSCHSWRIKCYCLTHPPLGKMAAILQMILSDAILWMKSFAFWLKFHRSLFLRVQMIINQHWLR